MVITILLLCAAVSAILCISSKYVGSAPALYIFKPLTTLLILTIAWYSGSGFAWTYANRIMAGLVFCLAGDIFLMLPSDRFTSGLTSFLIAHLLFIAAFSVNRSPGLTWWIALPLFICGVVISLLLMPHAGKMKIEVLAYMTVILVMTWQAWERWMDVKTGFPLLAGLGAFFFVFSDFILAFNRFRRNIRHADAVVLSTYYVAIAFMALSAGR